MVILCLGGGVAALDAQALFYLSPFVMRDLGVTNTQIGLLSAAVLVTWALSGFASSVLSDQLGGRKKYVVAAFALFGAFSFVSGLANSFLVLFLARMLIGVAEGPIVPLTQSIMMDESSPHRRGMNMGVVQSFGSQLIGSSLSPVLLVFFATVFSWRSAFFLAGLPGICVAILIVLFIREPQRVRTVHAPGPAFSRTVSHIRGLFRYRNIRLCAVLSCFLNAWYFGTLTFLPLYLVRFLHFTPRQMSMVLASSGVGAVLSAVIVPMLSDRFGRRPIMVIFALIGAIGPLGAVTAPPELLKIACLMFVGSWAQGLLPLCIGTVPLESVPNKDATASGLMMLTGMIAGGIAGPAFFGYLADAYDLSVPLWGCAGAAIVAALICSRLTETAPAMVGKTRASIAVRSLM